MVWSKAQVEVVVIRPKKEVVVYIRPESRFKRGGVRLNWRFKCDGLRPKKKV